MAVAADDTTRTRPRRRSSVVLADLAICEACLAELGDPRSRRFRFALLTCRSCGPRWAVARRGRFSRENSTFAGRAPCAECRAEFDHRSGRQRGNETIGCPACGPKLRALDARGAPLEEGEEALALAGTALREGLVVALKGFGGFSLVARADGAAATKGPLRDEGRPTALLFVDLRAIEQACTLSDGERTALGSSAAPVVLLRPSAATAKPALEPHPDRPWVAVTRAATALQHLLLGDAGGPLLATFGLHPPCPATASDAVAAERLHAVAAVVLAHDLQIARPMPEAVVQEVAGEMRVVQPGRGYAPLRLRLAEAVGAQDVLAVGAHRDCAVAVSHADTALLDQPVGRLDDLADFEAFRGALDDVAVLGGASPRTVVRDLHPDYLSGLQAERRGLPVLDCCHHLAHVLAVVAEHDIRDPVLGAAWDGGGLGPDGSLWGGEFLRVEADGHRREAHFRTFPLPGGEAAFREPRRAALGMLFEFLGHKVLAIDWLNPNRACTRRELQLFGAMLHRGLNTPPTSSVGRIFDAVASLAGLLQIESFPGQAALALEAAAAASRTDAVYPYAIDAAEGRPTLIDWEPMVREIVRDANRKVPPARIASRFHNTMAQIVVDVARRSGTHTVVLAGACFENRELAERSIARLRAESFEVRFGHAVPVGDGGIALGQIAWARRQGSSEVTHD